MFALSYAVGRRGHLRAGGRALAYTLSVDALVRVGTGVAFHPLITLTTLVLPPLAAAIVLTQRDVLVLLAVELAVPLVLVALVPSAFSEPAIVAGPMALTLVVGVLALAFMRHRDALERLRQEDLRAREEHFRALVANVPGVVYRVNRDSGRHVRYVSDGIRDLTGYGPEEFANIGRTLDDLSMPAIGASAGGAGAEPPAGTPVRPRVPPGRQRPERALGARSWPQSARCGGLRRLRRRGADRHLLRQSAIARAPGWRRSSRPRATSSGWRSPTVACATSTAPAAGSSAGATTRTSRHEASGTSIPLGARRHRERGNPDGGPAGRLGRRHGAAPCRWSRDPRLQVIMAHRSATGDVEFLSTIMRDLSERAAGEALRRESEERFRLLAAAAFEGIAITAEGRILDANEQLATMLGLERGQLIGRTVMDFVAPESREKVLDHQRRLSEEPYEHLALRADGSVFPVEIHARTIPFGGRLQRVTILRDLTERKRE